MTGTTEDRRVIEALADERYDARTLDPAVVISGARRRRTRQRYTTALASVAVAGVAVTGVIAAGGLGGSDATHQPPAAGSGGPGTPGTQPSGHTATTKVTPQVVSRWVPGGPIGAQPVGIIKKQGRVQIGDGYWFETKGTRWCITARDSEFGNLYQPFGCRGTVGNSNLGDGRSPSMQGSGDGSGRRVVSSVFRGEARRVIYSLGDRYYEAKVYKLAAVPGWRLSYLAFPSSNTEKANRPDRDQAVFVYDSRDRLIAQFPGPKDGGPTTDPLHTK